MAGLLLFETAIGTCGVAWGERGLTAVALPEDDERRLRAYLRRRAPEGAAELRESDPLPPEVRRAVDGIRALLAGADDDLADVPLDLDGVPPFHARVYAVARTVGPGETTTYGAVADRLGADRGAARAVGQALGANPWPIVVPCHRITAAHGGTGGFSAPGGVATKLRILEIERALGKGDPTLF